MKQKIETTTKRVQSRTCARSMLVWLLLGLSGTGCLETKKDILITLTTSASVLHFPFSGEEQSFTIDSNTNSWKISCDASWVTITPTTGANNATITVKAELNSETETRSATITITGTGILTPKIIPVSIDAAPLLIVTPPSLSFTASDSPKQLNVTSNTSWTVGNNPSWLSANPMSGANNGVLTITAAANTSVEQRTGSLSIISAGLTPRTVNVTQAGITPVLQVSTNALIFAATDSPKTFTVASNISWTVSFSAMWLSVDPMSGSGDGTVTVSPASNTNPAVRNVDLTVSGAGVSSQTVNVSQSGTAQPIDIAMAPVLGGTFTMGCTTSDQGSDCYSDERPSHSVTLSTFYIGKYEVTQGQWVAVMGTNPSFFKTGVDFPVEQVSWNDIVGTSGATMVINNITYYANGFIYKLNQMTGMQYRLPTEAEWEYAARGGRYSGGFKYSGSNMVDNVAWTSSNSFGSTHPVGSKAANELGIYDMSGNVWEWCSDWYGSYSDSYQSNPPGPSAGSNRVNRGGSWDYDEWNARVSLRHSNSPGTRSAGRGFRLSSSSN